MEPHSSTPQQNAPNRASFHERISKLSPPPIRSDKLEQPPKKNEAQPTIHRPRQADQTTFHNRLSQVLQQHADETAQREAHEPTPPSRQSARGFGPPVHQDSGFDEHAGDYPLSAVEAMNPTKALGSVAEGSIAEGDAASGAAGAGKEKGGKIER